MISLSALGHRLARAPTSPCPGRPAPTSVWTALSWASASPPSGPVTWRSTPRSFAAAFAPSMICWMNGLPRTWVTKPSLMASARGAPVGCRGRRRLAAGAAVAPADGDRSAAATPLGSRARSPRRSASRLPSSVVIRFLLAVLLLVGSELVGPDGASSRSMVPHPRSTASRARRLRWRRTSWSTATATMITAPGDERAPLGVDAEEQDPAADDLDDQGAQHGAEDGAPRHRTVACRR